MWFGVPHGGGFDQTQTPHRLRMQLATHSGVSSTLPMSSKLLKT
jgi:hypothetical protein